MLKNIKRIIKRLRHRATSLGISIITLTALTLCVLGNFTSTNAHALEGAEYASLTVNGKIYSFPIPNRNYKADLYLLKKALNGDGDAKDLLLCGKGERFFYIGDVGVNRWLRLTETNVEIIENKGV